MLFCVALVVAIDACVFETSLVVAAAAAAVAQAGGTTWAAAATRARSAGREMPLTCLGLEVLLRSQVACAATTGDLQLAFV